MMFKATALLLLFAFCEATSPPDVRPDATVVDCSPPLWNLPLDDNWPLAGISRKSRPKFRLIVKGIGADNIYTPGRRYNVILTAFRPKKSSKRIHGIILASKVDTDTCEAGTFSLKKGKKITPAVVKRGCNELTLDGSTDLSRTRGIQWTAPTCGCVTIQAEIKSSDRKLYHDDLETTEIKSKHKVLSKVICAPTEA